MCQDSPCLKVRPYAGQFADDVIGLGPDAVGAGAACERCEGAMCGRESVRPRVRACMCDIGLHCPSAALPHQLTNPAIV